MPFEIMMKSIIEKQDLVKKKIERKTAKLRSTPSSQMWISFLETLPFSGKWVGFLIPSLQGSTSA